MVTFECWLQMGELDIDALKVFKKKGNEFIVLSSKTQARVRELGKKWVEEKAANNPMFRKVLDSQINFEREWASVGQSRYFATEGK